MSDGLVLSNVGHLVIHVIFMLLSTIAVGLRFWARRIKKVSFELNDYLIAIGLVFSLGGAAFDIYGCCGMSFADPESPETMEKTMVFALKSQFVAPIVWVLAVVPIRASIIFLYIHVFRNSLFRIACFIALALNMAFLLGTILADCLICRPVAFRWNRRIEGGTCGDQRSFDLFVGTFNFLMDFALVLLPMPILWSLQMATGRKIALTAIFGMGIIICALTIYRIYVTSIINADNAKEMYPLVALLTSLEALLGVINACLPVMKPAFDKIHQSLSTRDDITIKTFMSDRVPRLLRLRHTWNWSYSSTPDRRTPSPEPSESAWMKDGDVPASKVERVIGMKVAEIHVRKEVDVESTLGNDAELLGKPWERRQDHW